MTWIWSGLMPKFLSKPLCFWTNLLMRTSNLHFRAQSCACGWHVGASLWAELRRSANYCGYCLGSILRVNFSNFPWELQLKLLIEDCPIRSDPAYNLVLGCGDMGMAAFGVDKREWVWLCDGDKMLLLTKQIYLVFKYYLLTREYAYKLFYRKLNPYYGLSLVIMCMYIYVFSKR